MRGLPDFVPDLSLLLTQLVVILGVAYLMGRAVGALGQPRIIGEMVAGFALGPSVLGTVASGTMQALFPADRMIPLATLSQLGVILFMFVVGLRLDLGLLKGRVRSAVVISHASIIVPFLLGSLLGTWLYPEMAGSAVARLPFVLFCGAAMSVTAFPVLAKILSDRALMGTRLGSMAIACAAVDDVTAWCLLAGIVAIARHQGTLTLLGLSIGGAAAYTVWVSTVGRRLLLRAWTAGRRHSPSAALDRHLVGAAVLIALASALTTEWLGIHPLFGAFLAGSVIPREAGLAGTIAEKIDSLIEAVLLPVFFVFTGLHTEVGLITGAGAWGIFAVLLAAAVTGKLAGSAGAARFMGMPWTESLALGVLMNTRGLMELVMLNVGLEIGVIGRELFTMMVLMALVTTVMTSPLLSLVLRLEYPRHDAASVTQL